MRAFLAQRQQYDYLFKIFLVGNALLGAGKTNLLTRYAKDSFSPTYNATIGIDYKHKIEEIDGIRFKLQIGDESGNERFRKISASYPYYPGIHGILIVYDITQKDSFDEVTDRFLLDIASFAQQDVVKVLVGCKCDKSDKREVSRYEAQQLADKYNMQFFETSAKMNINVEETFRAITNEIYLNRKKFSSLRKYEQRRANNMIIRKAWLYTKDDGIFSIWDKQFLILYKEAKLTFHEEEFDGDYKQSSENANGINLGHLDVKGIKISSTTYNSNHYGYVKILSASISSYFSV